MSATLPIIVYSDVICPWCYVGKRRLEAALGAPDMPEQVGFAWCPFQLNPDMPTEGMPRADYRKAKFGSLERSKQMDARVITEGKGEGTGGLCAVSAGSRHWGAAHSLGVRAVNFSLPSSPGARPWLCRGMGRLGQHLWLLGDRQYLALRRGFSARI